MFTLQTARPIYERRPPSPTGAADGRSAGVVSREAVDDRFAQLGLQIAAISGIAAILGFGVAMGVTGTGVSHEIPNPLASLRGLTELIAREMPVGDGRHRYVSGMLISIDRLNRLIEDLLLFSTVPRDEGDEVDLAAAAVETVTMARAAAGNRPIAIALDNELDGPALVRGTRERVVQAITNLVLNATQAAPDGGCVTLRLAQRGDRAILAVHNTGSFITPEVRRQLFVPFFTTKSGGTGLGLAIARQIVTRIDGRIEVETDSRSATTFIVDLPLTLKEEPAFA